MTATATCHVEVMATTTPDTPATGSHRSASRLGVNTRSSRGVQHGHEDAPDPPGGEDEAEAPAARPDAEQPVGVRHGQRHEPGAGQRQEEADDRLRADPRVPPEEAQPFRHLGERAPAAAAAPGRSAARDRRVRIAGHADRREREARARRSRAATPGGRRRGGRPASIGMPRSRSEPTPHTAEFASPMRSRPTIAGRAPKAAPSKKTNAAWLRNPAASACHGGERRPATTPAAPTR